MPLLTARFAPVITLLQQQGDTAVLGQHWVERYIKRIPELKTRIGRCQEAARFNHFISKAVNWYFDIRENEYS